MRRKKIGNSPNRVHVISRYLIGYISVLLDMNTSVSKIMFWFGILDTVAGSILTRKQKFRLGGMIARTVAFIISEVQESVRLNVPIRFQTL